MGSKAHFLSSAHSHQDEWGDHTSALYLISHGTFKAGVTFQEMGLNLESE